MKFVNHLIVSFFLAVCFTGASYGQDTLVHRTLDFYLEQGLANSPLLKETNNALALNRLDSLLNVAINKPYV